MSSTEPIPPASIPVASSVEEARSAILRWRSQGNRVGLVPTMGALHEGHLSLVRAARRHCDACVVTIFVNPSQFGPSEDFTKYPRTLTADLTALAELQVDLVFAPEKECVYPEGHSTTVSPPRVAEPLEGERRPGHFEGVCTIVLKLFQMLPADVAFFGQKDYQQTRVIRDMVRDLNVPIEIDVRPTVREADGLALSSRNRYLSIDERRRAVALSKCLARAEELLEAGEMDGAVVEAAMRRVLLDHDVTNIDYTALVDPESLESLGVVRRPAAALVAAHVGKTRLIDNRLIQ